MHNYHEPETEAARLNSVIIKGAICNFEKKFKLRYLIFSIKNYKFRAI